MADMVGVILAGGKSSRMGEDKAGLRLHGKKLLQYMEQLLRASGIENIYISHPDIIPDDIHAYGPLSGIHAILKYVPKHHTHLIFVPIDMPALTISLIKRLISAPDNFPLVHFKSYKMPFRLSIDRRWLELAEEHLRKGDDVSLGSFHKSIPDHCATGILPDEQHCFININTPEEWRAFSTSEQS